MTSGSVRSTKTAVLHRGHRYAPDAPHEAKSQSQWLVGDTENTEMRSLEGMWSGMSAKARKTWRSSALPRRVVYDGRPLNAAADAVMRRCTWKEYGANILVRRIWRNHGVATWMPWRGLEVAAVGVCGGRRWEPRSTSRPAFMVSKAADAAVWEDLKDIKPPTYDGNPLNLDRFLENMDDWGMTVTENMDPAEAERYVFKRFRYHLPEVLQELYSVATKEGKIKTLKEANK